MSSNQSKDIHHIHWKCPAFYRWIDACRSSLQFLYFKSWAVFLLSCKPVFNPSGVIPNDCKGIFTPDVCWERDAPNTPLTQSSGAEHTTDFRGGLKWNRKLVQWGTNGGEFTSFQIVSKVGSKVELLHLMNVQQEKIHGLMRSIMYIYLCKWQEETKGYGRPIECSLLFNPQRKVYKEHMKVNPQSLPSPFNVFITVTGPLVSCCSNYTMLWQQCITSPFQNKFWQTSLLYFKSPLLIVENISGSIWPWK